MASIALPQTLPAKIVLISFVLLALGCQVQGREEPAAASAQPAKDSIALSELPVQGRRTYQAILDGGPFRHQKDGSVFGNREQLLPREARGHYLEYTVDTPGVRDRGAQRIVCGGAPRAPSACWYTADHYASFRRIAP